MVTVPGKLSMECIKTSRATTTRTAAMAIFRILSGPSNNATDFSSLSIRVAEGAGQLHTTFTWKKLDSGALHGQILDSAGAKNPADQPAALMRIEDRPDRAIRLSEAVPIDAR